MRMPHEDESRYRTMLLQAKKCQNLSENQQELGENQGIAFTHSSKKGPALLTPTSDVWPLEL